MELGKKLRERAGFFGVQPSKGGVNELLRAAAASVGVITCRLPPLMVAGDAVDMKMEAEVEVVGAAGMGAGVVVDVVLGLISIPPSSTRIASSSSSTSRCLSSSMRLS